MKYSLLNLNTFFQLIGTVPEFVQNSFGKGQVTACFFEKRSVQIIGTYQPIRRGELHSLSSEEFCKFKGFWYPPFKNLLIQYNTVSAQKLAPSLLFWRFFTFLQLYQILTYTLQISTVFILALWELAKKNSALYKV
jgi:hypothetical protein